MNNLLISTRPSNIFFSLYLGGIITYNIFTIYSNGSEQLLEYRKTHETFKNETESIIVGIQKKWFDNLLLSIFWPFRLPFQIVPMVILNLNPEKKESISYKKEVINIKKEEHIKSNGRIINHPQKIVTSNIVEKLPSNSNQIIPSNSDQRITSNVIQTVTSNIVEKLPANSEQQSASNSEQQSAANSEQQSATNSEQQSSVNSEQQSSVNSEQQSSPNSKDTSNQFNFGDHQITFDFSQIN